MLPDLGQIAWEEHEHAYGRADDVPAMLRRMLDPKTATLGFDQFEAAVNHQGWATPAAVPCMPWLVAALDEPNVPLGKLVPLLANLAMGGSHANWLSERLDIEPPAELYEPVRGAHGRFVELLRHDDGDVRAAAALAVGVLRSEAPAALPALREALAAERKGDVRASMILALGTIGDPSDLARIDEAAAGKRIARSVAIAARCARLWLSPADVTDEDLLGLLAETRAETTARVPWADGGLGRLAEVLALRAIRDLAPARVLRLLEVVDASVAPEIAARIVASAFPKDCAPVQSASDLTAEQRVALLLAAQHPSFSWNWVGDHLAAADLPRAPREIRVFLGDEAPGALDRVVPLNGRSTLLWRALRSAMRSATSVEELVAATRELGREAVIAAADELALENYHYADINVPDGATRFSHEDAPAVDAAYLGMARLLAAMLEPFGADLVADAARRLAPQLERDRPNTLLALTWLTVLARRGALDARWDPLVAGCMQAPPASRAPHLLGEILRAIPLERREPMVLAVPLLVFSTSRTESGGQIVFESRSAWGGEGWWYLGACESAGARAALLEAVRQWSTLPPHPERDEIPRGCFCEPHAPFPLRRAAEIFAAWSPAFTSDGLDELEHDPEVDRELLAKLRALVPS